MSVDMVWNNSQFIDTSISNDIYGTGNIYFGSSKLYQWYMELEIYILEVQNFTSDISQQYEIQTEWTLTPKLSHL